jgi:hypothetical protein
VRFVIRERTLFKKIVVIILFLSFPDSNSSRGRQSRRAGETRTKSGDRWEGVSERNKTRSSSRRVEGGIAREINRDSG